MTVLQNMYKVGEVARVFEDEEAGFYRIYKRSSKCCVSSKRHNQLGKNWLAIYIVYIPRGNALYVPGGKRYRHTSM